MRTWEAFSLSFLFMLHLLVAGKKLFFLSKGVERENEEGKEDFISQGTNASMGPDYGH